MFQLAFLVVILKKYVRRMKSNFLLIIAIFLVLTPLVFLSAYSDDANNTAAKRILQTNPFDFYFRTNPLVENESQVVFPIVEDKNSFSNWIPFFQIDFRDFQFHNNESSLFILYPSSNEKIIANESISLIFTDFRKLDLLNQRNIISVENQSDISSRSLFFSSGVLKRFVTFDPNQSNLSFILQIESYGSNPENKSKILDFSGISSKNEFFYQDRIISGSFFFQVTSSIKDFIVLDISLFSEFMPIAEVYGVHSHYLVYSKQVNVATGITTLQDQLQGMGADLETKLKSAEVEYQFFENLAVIRLSYSSADFFVFQFLLILISVPLFYFIFYFSLNLAEIKENNLRTEIGILKIRGSSRKQLGVFILGSGFLSALFAYFLLLITILVMFNFGFLNSELSITNFVILLLIALGLGVFLEFLSVRNLIYHPPYSLMIRNPNPEFLKLSVKNYEAADSSIKKSVGPFLAKIYIGFFLLTYLTNYLQLFDAFSSFSLIYQTVFILSLLGQITFVMSPIMLPIAIVSLIDGKNDFLPKIIRTPIRLIFKDGADVIVKTSRFLSINSKRLMLFSVLLLSLSILPLVVIDSTITWVNTQPEYQLGSDFVVEGDFSTMSSNQTISILQKYIPQESVNVSIYSIMIYVPNNHGGISPTYLSAFDPKGYSEILSRSPQKESNVIQHTQSGLGKLVNNENATIILKSVQQQILTTDSGLTLTIPLNNTIFPIEIVDTVEYFPGLGNLFSTSGSLIDTASLFVSENLFLKILNISSVSEIKSQNIKTRILYSIDNPISDTKNAFKQIAHSLPESTTTITISDAYQRIRDSPLSLLLNVARNFIFFTFLLGILLFSISNTAVLSSLLVSGSKGFAILNTRGMKPFQLRILFQSEFLVPIFVGLSFGFMIGIGNAFFAITWIIPLINPTSIPIDIVLDAIIFVTFIVLFAIQVVISILYFETRKKLIFSFRHTN